VVLFCFFLLMPISYGYFHVLTSSPIHLLFGALNCQVHHWHNERPCQDAWFHLPWKGEYFIHLLQSHATMMWHGLCIEPHLLWLHWWFITLCHPLEQMFFPWGWMNLKVGCDFVFFPTLGAVSSSAISPHILTTHGSS
jgi:hypothetical protein